MARLAVVAYRAVVHPIEHLRYVARSGAVGGHALVRDTAYALASLGADHADLLISCRRILGRQPAAGPLWAACARLVTATEPARLAWDLVDRDPVDVRAVARHLPAGAAIVAPAEWADVAVVAAAVDRADGSHGESPSPTVVVVDDGTGSAERLRRSVARRDVEVVVVGPTELGTRPVVFEPALVAIGTMIAPAAVAATVACAAGEAWAAVAEDDVLPAAFGLEALARIGDDPRWAAIDPDLVAGVVGASGRRPVGELATSVPFAPELLRAPI